MTLKRIAALFVILAVASPPLPARGRADGPASVGKPHVVWKKIPFGPKRRRETAAYSKRHYGYYRWRLVEPKAVVEHYTGGNSFSSAWNTFANNSPHLGELPGTCAHFIIDADGTVYQLVPLGTRCRHAIGMNWTAFGIEHVGTSDAQVLHNSAQMHASLRLTLWLVSHYHLQIRNVIGHAETLESPYHRERYTSWRCQTHGDWNRRDMNIYRRKLKRLARRRGVPIGPPPQWVDPHC